MSAVFSVVLAVLAASALAITPPKWPSKYYLEGEFQTIEAHQNLPFIVNWDEANHRESLVYFNKSMDYTIWDGGKYYYVHVVKDHQQCVSFDTGSIFEMPLTAMLPDISNYTYIGVSNINGNQTQHWQWNDVEGDPATTNCRTNVYDMFVKEDGTPVRFDIHGYNIILGSHYDIYRFEYTKFSPNTNERGAYTEPAICETPSAIVINEEEFDTYDRQGQMMRSLTTPRDAFNRFASRYHREYASQEEREYRRKVFEENMRTINSINERQSSWRAAPNRFADFTMDEIRAFFTGRPTESRSERPSPTRIEKVNANDTFPTSLDWRVIQPGVVGRVKDQCACGSCWTFAAIGALEGRYAVAKNITTHEYLSEQYVVDCFWSNNDHGCNGGFSEDVFAWLVDNKLGVAPEQGYEYIGLDSWCYDSRAQSKYTPSSWAMVESGSQESLKKALQKGPVAVAICVPESMIWYSSGVYKDDLCSADARNLGHAVTAVGYGTDAVNGDYWIIKNSWSSWWGNNGYIYISAAENMCGVTTDASFPDFD